jgi:DUF177 domain-containing protein
MSEAWSKLRDIDLAADGRVRIDFSITFDELPRLRPQLRRGENRVTGQVRFDREQGWAVAEVEIAGCAVLTCQRCLAPLEWPIACRGRVILVAGAAEAERAPQELETVLAPDRRVSVRDLVEEELLLALPLVPAHAVGGCGSASEARSVDRSSAGEKRQRPFEQLDELLGRRP